MEQTVPNIDNDYTVYMDHDRLPTMSNYTFFGSDVMAHQLNDFAYECMAQTNSGSFHVTTAPGLFSIGAKEWLTPSGPNADVKMTLNIVRAIDNNIYNTHTVITGCQQAQVFFSPGDMFSVSFDPSLNDSNLQQIELLGSSELLITRLSRNPYYVPQIPVM